MIPCFRADLAIDDGEDHDDTVMQSPQYSPLKISQPTPPNERWLGWQHYSFTNMVSNYS